MGTYFSLAVKGLYAGTAYLVIVLLLEMQFPGSLNGMAFSILGISSVLILFALEFIFDYT